jgi:hypothetical protein
VKPRLEKGQVRFEDMPLPLRTCHDIRKWRGCVLCKKLGDKNQMLQSSKETFWHGRCFAKQFGTDRLLELPREQLEKLSLGDLGLRLMRAVVDGLPR